MAWGWIHQLRTGSFLNFKIYTWSFKGSINFKYSDVHLQFSDTVKGKKSISFYTYVCVCLAVFHFLKFSRVSVFITKLKIESSLSKTFPWRYDVWPEGSATGHTCSHFRCLPHAKRDSLRLSQLFASLRGQHTCHPCLKGISCTARTG